MVRRTSVNSAAASLIVDQNPEVIVEDDLPVMDTEEQKALDARIIRGKFHFYERPGGTHCFVYRRYKGENIVSYRLVDGRTYDLPWGVVRALEESSYYMSHNIEETSKHDNVVTVGEQPVYATSRGKARFSFMPVIR